MRWVVNATPRQLYPREKLGTDWTIKLYRNCIVVFLFSQTCERILSSLHLHTSFAVLFISQSDTSTILLSCKCYTAQRQELLALYFVKYSPDQNC